MNFIEWLKRMFAVGGDKEFYDAMEQLILYQERTCQSNNLAVMPRQTFHSGYAVSALCKGRGVMDRDVKKPSTYEEAMGSEHTEYWRTACHEEHRSLLEKGVYRSEKWSPHQKILTTRWVFDKKVNPQTGEVERFKARIVARGFEQEWGIDYENVFAPVVSYSTLRAFLSVMACDGMKVYQLDVKTAFLNGELNEEVLVRPPPGTGRGEVWRLLKGLYGLKQAAKC